MSTEEYDKARCCMFCRGDESTTHSACRCHDRDQWWMSYLNRDGDGGDPERNAFDFAWDARGQVTPDREALKHQALSLEDEQFAKSTLDYKAAGYDNAPNDYDRAFFEAGYRRGIDAIIALFNEKGNE